MVGRTAAWARIGVAVARHPGLWPTAIKQVARTAPSGWYRRWPFLPVPTTEYLRFRLMTQYGSADQHPLPPDVLNYLLWCRRAAS